MNQWVLNNHNQHLVFTLHLRHHSLWCLTCASQLSPVADRQVWLVLPHQHVGHSMIERVQVAESNRLKFRQWFSCSLTGGEKKKKPAPDTLEFVHPSMQRKEYPPNRRAVRIRGDYPHKGPSTVPETCQCSRAVSFPAFLSWRPVLNQN